MNKKELIDKAREYLLKGEKGVDEYRIYTAKIDLDEKLSWEYVKTKSYVWSSEIDQWNATRRTIMESLGLVVIDINTTETERGQHTIINYLSKDNIDDEYKNFLQLLLGDDVVRYKINKRRIERGIPFDTANILFSKILKRYPHEEDSKIKVALERIIGEIK